MLSIIWLFDYLIIWLFDYLIIWLFDYLIIWLFDYLIIWLFDYLRLIMAKFSGKTDRRNDTLAFYSRYYQTIAKLSPNFNSN